MGSITTSADLSVAPEKAWAIMVSPAQFENWLTIHTNWKNADVPAEFTEGLVIPQVATMMGMPNTITWTVSEVAAPQSLKMSGAGFAGVKIAFAGLIEETGSGCKLTLELEYSGQMIVGALGKAMEKEGLKQLNASLEKFAALV